MYQLNLAYYPKQKILLIKKIRIWFKKNKIYANEKKILIMLNIIGYDISKSINNKYYYQILLNNYRNHFFKKLTLKIQI